MTASFREVPYRVQFLTMIAQGGVWPGINGLIGPNREPEAVCSREMVHSWYGRRRHVGHRLTYTLGSLRFCGIDQ